MSSISSRRSRWPLRNLCDDQFVRFLCPEAESKFSKKGCLGGPRDLWSVSSTSHWWCYGGVSNSWYCWALSSVIAYVRKKFGIKLRLKLPADPCARRSQLQKFGVASANSVSKDASRSQHRRLRSRIGPLVCAVTPKTMRLFDLSGQRVLRSSCCSVARKESDTIWIPEASCFSSASHEERISRQCETALLH